jgi:hypothetical protein
LVTGVRTHHIAGLDEFSLPVVVAPLDVDFPAAHELRVPDITRIREQPVFAPAALRIGRAGENAKGRGEGSVLGLELGH